MGLTKYIGPLPLFKIVSYLGRGGRAWGAEWEIVKKEILC